MPYDKRLIIHAGLHKTGSSSIQRTAFQAQQQGILKGLSYWDISQEHNAPITLIFRHFDNHAPVFARLGIHSAAEKDHHAHLCMSHLRNFIHYGAETIMISVEDLTDLSEADLLEMANYFHALFREVTLIAYAREPEDAFSSVVQELIKSGCTTEEIEQHLSEGTPLASSMLSPVNLRIEKLQRSFEKARFVLRAYDRSIDLLADFCASVDIPLLPAASTDNNIRASQSFIQQLSQLNTETPLLRKGFVNPQRDPWITQQSQHFSGPAYLASPSLKDQWRLSSAKDRTWFEQHFPEVRPVLQTPVSSDTSEIQMHLPDLHAQSLAEREHNAMRRLTDAINSQSPAATDITSMRFCADTDLLLAVYDLQLKHHQYTEAKLALRMAVLRGASSPDLWKNYIRLCHLTQAASELEDILHLQPENRRNRIRNWQEKLAPRLPDLAPVNTLGTTEKNNDGSVSGWLVDPRQTKISLPFVVRSGDYVSGIHCANRHIGAVQKVKGVTYCGFTFWPDPRITPGGRIDLLSVNEEQVFLSLTV